MKKVAGLDLIKILSTGKTKSLQGLQEQSSKSNLKKIVHTYLYIGLLNGNTSVPA